MPISQTIHMRAGGWVPNGASIDPHKEKKGGGKSESHILRWRAPRRREQKTLHNVRATNSGRKSTQKLDPTSSRGGKCHGKKNGRHDDNTRLNERRRGAKSYLRRTLARCWQTKVCSKSRLSVM